MPDTAPTNPPYYHANWQEISDLCRQLADTLTSPSINQQCIRMQKKRILGISRGGMIPATLLANHLNIRVLDSICLEGYDGETMRDDIKILKPATIEDGADLLIVDDLVDTGRSAALVKSLFPLATLAVLYAKPNGLPYTDITMKHIPQDTWICFPWD